MSGKADANALAEPTPHVSKSSAGSIKLHFSCKSLPRASESFKPIMLSNRLSTHSKSSTFKRNEQAQVKLGRLPNSDALKVKLNSVVPAEAASFKDLNRGFDCRVMSHKHASISWNSRGALLTDTGSTHGTFVSSKAYRQLRNAQGQPSWDPAFSITPAIKLKPNVPLLLSNGDLVTFGKDIERMGSRHQAMRCIVEYTEPTTASLKPLNSGSVTIGPVSSSQAPPKPSMPDSISFLLNASSQQPVARKSSGRYSLVFSDDEEIEEPKGIIKPCYSINSDNEEIVGAKPVRRSFLFSPQGPSISTSPAIRKNESNGVDLQETTVAEAVNSQTAEKQIEPYKAVNDHIQNVQTRMHGTLKNMQEGQRKRQMSDELSRLFGLSSSSPPATSRKFHHLDLCNPQRPRLAETIKPTSREASRSSSSMSNTKADNRMENDDNEERDKDNSNVDESNRRSSSSGGQDMDELSDSASQHDSVQSDDCGDSACSCRNGDLSDAESSLAEDEPAVDQEDEQDDDNENGSQQDEEDVVTSHHLPEVNEAHQTCSCCSATSEPSENGESQVDESIYAARSDAPEVEERAYSVVEPIDKRDLVMKSAIAAEEPSSEHDPMLVEYGEEEEEFDEFEQDPLSEASNVEPSSELETPVEVTNDAVPTTTTTTVAESEEEEEEEEEGSEPEDLEDSPANALYSSLIKRLNDAAGVELFEPGQLQKGELDNTPAHRIACRQRIALSMGSFDEETFIKECAALPKTVTEIRELNEGPRCRSMLAFAGMLLNLTRWSTTQFKRRLELCAADDGVLTAAGHDTSMNALLKRLNILLLHDLRSGSDMPAELKEAYKCYAQGASWMDYRSLMHNYVWLRCAQSSEWDLADGWQEARADDGTEAEDGIEYPTHPSKPFEWVEELDDLIEEEAASGHGDGDVALLLTASKDVQALRVAALAEVKMATPSQIKPDDEYHLHVPTGSFAHESTPAPFSRDASPRSAEIEAEAGVAADHEELSSSASSGHNSCSWRASRFRLSRSCSVSDSNVATSVADVAEKSAQTFAQVEAVFEAERAVFDAEMKKAEASATVLRSSSGTKRSAKDVAQEDESIDSQVEDDMAAPFNVQVAPPHETRPAKRARSFGAVATAAAAGAAFGAVSTFLGLVSIATLYRD